MLLFSRGGAIEELDGFKLICCDRARWKWTPGRDHRQATRHGPDGYLEARSTLTNVDRLESADSDYDRGWLRERLGRLVVSTMAPMLAACWSAEWNEL